MIAENKTHIIGQDILIYWEMSWRLTERRILSKKRYSSNQRGLSKLLGCGSPV